MAEISRRKQSIVAGGLTSSAGIFLSKVMGILYVVPFAALATEANLTYYARAYSIYDIILNVSIAGIPYAIATMIAKYTVREDYRTIVLIRKLSTGILAASGFLAMLVGLVFAGQIAGFTVQAAPGTEIFIKTRNVIMIIALDMFFAPLLSSFRGFHQGTRNLKSYAFSQVLEQFIRIVFLLGLGFLAVYIFKADSMWAVYFAVLATSVSSVAAILYFIFVDRKEYPPYLQKARRQEFPAVDVKTLLQEMFTISVPYLVIVFLGSNMNFSNLLFFNKAMLAHGETIVQTNLFYSLMSFTSAKLISIPVVVSMGFSIAIIPFLTTAVERNDTKLIRKYAEDAMDTVLYLGIPLCFYLYALSTEIYYTMYGADNYRLGGYVLALSAGMAFFSTFNPILSQLMMNLRLRRVNIRNLLIGFLIALLSVYPLTRWLGFKGAILSGMLSSFFIMVANLSIIHKQTQFNFKLLLRRLMVVLMGIAAMQIVFMILRLLQLQVITPSRWLALFNLGIYGLLGAIAYLLMTGLFSLPQTLFHIDFNQLKARFLRK